MKFKKLFAAALTLSGTIIGAGILGLPYVFSRAGFLIGLFWLVFLGFFMTLTYLYIAEVSLRTKEKHQLTGLAEKYLGKKGKYLMLFTIVFGIYSSLVAYLIGEGESLSFLFFGCSDYSIYFSILFWVVMTLLLEGGIERLKKVESYVVLAIILIIAIVFVLFLPKVELANLTSVNHNLFFFAIWCYPFCFTRICSYSRNERGIKGK